MQQRARGLVFFAISVAAAYSLEQYFFGAAGVVLHATGLTRVRPDY